MSEQRRDPVRVGNGGHACGPAGRGNQELPRWTCEQCQAVWRPVTSQRTERNPVVTVTWERVMG